MVNISVRNALRGKPWQEIESGLRTAGCDATRDEIMECEPQPGSDPSEKTKKKPGRQKRSTALKTQTRAAFTSGADPDPGPVPPSDTTTEPTPPGFAYAISDLLTTLTEQIGEIRNQMAVLIPLVCPSDMSDRTITTEDHAAIVDQLRRLETQGHDTGVQMMTLDAGIGLIRAELTEIRERIKPPRLPGQKTEATGRNKFGTTLSHETYKRLIQYANEKSLPLSEATDALLTEGLRATHVPPAGTDDEHVV